MDLTEFLSEFQLEAGEKLDLIASQLLRLERDATNPQPVREMFLAAHTIKGGAAMMRLTEVEALAHALEDLLSSFRDTDRMLDAPAADLLFQAIDRLRALVANASGASVGAEPGEALLAFAHQLRSGSTAGSAIAAAPPTRRALVVEDSATVRELHRMVLQESGYEVEACGDGAKALECAAQATALFSLVVAGLQLPGLNGFDLTSALRTKPAYRNVPIVLTSADVDAALSLKATTCGAQALIRKGSLRENALAAFIRQLS